MLKEILEEVQNEGLMDSFTDTVKKVSKGIRKMLPFLTDLEIDDIKSWRSRENKIPTTNIKLLDDSTHFTFFVIECTDGTFSFFCQEDSANYIQKMVSQGKVDRLEVFRSNEKVVNNDVAYYIDFVKLS